MPSRCSMNLIESDRSDQPLRFALAGRVAMESAQELHRMAIELSRRGRDVTVCCQGVEYLDSSAIQVLLCLGRELELQNRICELTGLTGQARSDFRRVGLAHVLADEC
jgi:anti-anti-sigma regulatory factor